MVIVTCFHGRPKLSEVFLEHSTALGKVYAACSVGDEDNIALCELYGVTFTAVPNNPVSRKWQAALDLVPEGERVMILGSDDFASREWWGLTEDHEADFIMPTSLSMWEPSTGRACILGKSPMGAQAYGAGRVLSPALLAKVRPMWGFDADCALDTMAMTACRVAGFEPVYLDVARVPVCDVKTEENIWGYGRGFWARRAAQSTPEEAAWMLDRKSFTALTWLSKA